MSADQRPAVPWHSDPLMALDPLADELGVDPYETDLEGRAVKGFAWVSLASISAKLLVFLMTLVLARLLVPREFGVVAAALSAIGYLEIGLDLGVGDALVYGQERGVTAQARSAFTLNLLVSFFCAAGFYLASPALASFFHVAADANVFRLLALYILVRGAGQIHDAMLRRDLQFKRILVVQLARAVVRATVTVALAFAGFGAWSLAIGLVAGETVAVVCLWSLVHVTPTLHTKRVDIHPLLKYGLGILALTMVAQVGFNSDYLVVGSALGPVALGLYTMGFRLPELVVNNTLTVFSYVAFPAFSKAREQRPGALQAVMLRTLPLTTLFGLTTGVGLAIASRDLVHVLFGANWDPAAAPMAVVALTLGVAATGYGSGDLFKALGRLGTLTWLTALSTVVSVTGFVLVVHDGITAVALCHLVAAVITETTTLVVATRLVGVRAVELCRAMRPGVASATGIVLLALPVREVTTVGLTGLLSVVGAGIIGATLGLAVTDRWVFGEIRGLVARMRH